MSGALMAGVMAGGASYVLTVGSGTITTTNYGFKAGTFGSLAPTEFLESTITSLRWATTVNRLFLNIADDTHDNDGWTSISINGTVFLRSAATYNAGLWKWDGVTTNPFGTTAGVIIPVNIA
jgi:hypothetical protein